MGLSRTPFYDQHVAGGGRIVPFAGFEMPVQYSGVVQEHLRVRESVGLFDVSHMGEVRVRGPKAAEAISALTTNDTFAIPTGSAQYNVLTNDKGGAVDDIFVYKVADDDFLICVNAANRDKDFAWMTAHNAFPSGATFTDEGWDWAQVAIQGRNGVKVTQKLTDLPVDTFGHREFRIGRFGGVDGCIVARTGYTGEDGFEVFIPTKRAEPLWGEILKAGEEFGILPIGLGARDTLRLEVRNVLYGHELTDETSPYQAGLGWIVKLDKPGGFVGRDAIAARKGKESHRLVGFVVDGTRIARDGMPILVDGREVGKVTSGTRAPSLEKNVGMGYVEAAYVKPGTRLTIDVRGKTAEAEVVSGPFYKRPY